jgi:dTDP-4-amino-4,6-dideoxygalactose transaminase
MNKISLAAVNIPEETYPLMEMVLRAGKIGQSEYIEQFEDAIKRYVGADYCIAISNGTMADAVAVAAIKEHRWPHIVRAIVPALTFIAQPNSVLYNNMEVVFVDVKEDWTLDVSGIKHTLKNSIVFGTDLMGRQCLEQMDVEDACESFASRYKGKASGTFGVLGTYSFFPSHTISTGEGGAIVTNCFQLAQLCRSMRAHGATSKDPMDKFHFPNFGFNARLSTIQAVLGIALMMHIDEYVSKRRENFHAMEAGLGGFYERDGEEIVPHGYPVEFESEDDRNNAMRALGAAGIECRKFFSCIPLEEPHHLKVGKFPVAEHISHTHLYLPCHQNMTLEDVEYVCHMVLAQKGCVRLRKPVNKDCCGTKGEQQCKCDTDVGESEPE